jgi:hypothetical protein
VRDRTLDGHWWLPEKEDTKVAGIVTFDGTEPSLRLLGAFTYRVEERPGVFSVKTIETAPLIHGNCDGKQVTLLSCRQSLLNTKFSATTAWRQTFAAQFMLVGIWLERPDEEYFDEIVIGIDNLLAWSTKSGLEREDVEIDGRWTSTAVKWQRVEELTAQIGAAEVRLALGFTFSSRYRADRAEESLAESATFRVTVPELQSTEALVTDWTRALQDLITLAMDTPCALDEVTLIRTNPPAEVVEPEPKRSIRSSFITRRSTSGNLTPRRPTSHLDNAVSSRGRPR